jgi:hypothetical protein
MSTSVYIATHHMKIHDATTGLSVTDEVLGKN